MWSGKSAVENPAINMGFSPDHQKGKKHALKRARFSKARL